MNPQCAAEHDAWRDVKDGWRPLYGDVDSMGVAVEWHDFRMARSFNWGRTFHPRSLEFCLNLEGHGEVGRAGKTPRDLRRERRNDCRADTSDVDPTPRGRSQSG